MKKETVGKVAKIVVGGKTENVVWGTVNDVGCKILIDSGAEVGVVPRALVKSDSNQCGKVHISNVHGVTEVHNSTIVTYVVGGLKTTRLAVIDERAGEDVIAIIPFDVMNESESSTFKLALSEYREECVKEKGVSENDVSVKP